MKPSSKILIVATAIVGAAAIPAIAGARNGPGAAGDDRDVPIQGAALERASAAALSHLGGGRVTGTEVGDEESYYEVEVTLDDGSQIDVQLDEGFNIVSTERDGPDEDD